MCLLVDHKCPGIMRYSKRDQPIIIEPSAERSYTSVSSRIGSDER